MTSYSSVSGCAAYDRPASTSLNAYELRGLRALRRAGSRGILNQILNKKMRPAHGTVVIRIAIRHLEDLGLIQYARAAGAQTRVQGLWRITDRGRAIIDEIDRSLPPAA
jgi:hypothetical protein